MIGLLAQAGCTDKPSETTAPESTAATPAESTPELTPTESTSELTPIESTPEATPDVSLPDSTPEVTVPATPPVGSTPETTPEVTVPETTPETTPVETPSDLNAVYSITIDLDGGMAAEGNPETYTYFDKDITLLTPIKPGYAFAGWVGTGIATVAEKVVIKSGSFGDRVYTATWKDAENVHTDSKHGDDPVTDEEKEALRDSHNSLTANPAELPLSVATLSGAHGEGLFLAKTAYTDITVDGVMDAAYTYGLRFEMDMVQTPTLYENRDTGYDVYMVMGQDGKMHVFVDVHDLDVVINDEMWAYKWWHCDTWQMYIDFGNDRTANDYLWTFAGRDSEKYAATGSIKFPENWKVVETEDGFHVEFEFDNNDKPFKYGDEFSFGFFYNDTMNYKSTSSYDRSNTGTKSVLDPNFHLSNVTIQDAVMITSFPLNDKTDEIPEGVTPEKTGKIFTDIVSGAASLGIVTSKYYSAYNEINVENLINELDELGINVRLVREDKLSASTKFDYTIYLNTTSDAFAAEAFSTLNYTNCGVVVGEDKMVGFGWTWDGNDLLCDIILAIFANSASNEEVAVGSRYMYTLESVVGDKVPLVEDTYCIIDSGEDAYVIVKQNTTLEYYNEYVTLIEAAGYALYDSNEMATVTTATYYDDETVISLLYSSAEGDKTMRVVVETMSKTSLAPLTADAIENPGVSSVTQVDMGAGLCHIIKLSNGEFIIVDSGNQGKSDKIYEALASLHKSNKPIVVAAWIFTHFHQDHVGGFCDFADNETYLSKVQIKAIMYNPPERFFLDISKQNSAGDKGNIIRWRGHLEKLSAGGTKIYQVRTGQRYAFENAMIEILGTFDDLAPFYMRADSSNHTSIIFSVTLEGQKLMYVGDASSYGLLLAAKRYGDYLKSDVVQLAHHGNGDGSSDSAFYQKVNATLVLHPGTSLSGGAERWAYNNAKEKYSYGIGNKTIELPHYVQ